MPVGVLTVSVIKPTFGSDRRPRSLKHALNTNSVLSFLSPTPGGKMARR